MNPAGLYPPLLASVLVSTIELALLTCRVMSGNARSGEERDGEESNEDRRLSFRFCSACNSRIASSIEEVMLRRSAVRSRFVMFDVYAPCKTWRSGVGWRRARLRPDAVRRMGFGDLGKEVVDRGEVLVFVSAAVAEVATLGRVGRGRGMFNGTN
jgi:hypothetical protein